MHPPRTLSPQFPTLALHFRVCSKATPLTSHYSPTQAFTLEFIARAIAEKKREFELLRTVGRRWRMLSASIVFRDWACVALATLARSIFPLLPLSSSHPHIFQARWTRDRTETRLRLAQKAETLKACPRPTS